MKTICFRLALFLFYYYLFSYLYGGLFMAGKYDELADFIVENVGGKENVNSLSHCITRLRFKLKDESIANTDALKNKDGVVTVMQSGGQYQVVIGNHVPDVYATIGERHGLGGTSAAAADEPAVSFNYIFN